MSTSSLFFHLAPRLRLKLLCDGHSWNYDTFVYIHDAFLCFNIITTFMVSINTHLLFPSLYEPSVQSEGQLFFFYWDLKH